MKATKITTLFFNSLEEIFDFLDERNLRAYKISITIIDENKKSKIGIETNQLQDGNFLNRIAEAKKYLFSQYKIKSDDNENTVLYLDLK